MPIVSGWTVASSGMATADRHGASSIFSVKLPTDLGVCPSASWTRLTIAPTRSRRSSPPAGLSAGVTQPRGRVIAWTGALYADGRLKGKKTMKAVRFYAKEDVRVE